MARRGWFVSGVVVAALAAVLLVPVSASAVPPGSPPWPSVARFYTSGSAVGSGYSMAPYLRIASRPDAGTPDFSLALQLSEPYVYNGGLVADLRWSYSMDPVATSSMWSVSFVPMCSTAPDWSQPVVERNSGEQILDFTRPYGSGYGRSGVLVGKNTGMRMVCPTSEYMLGYAVYLLDYVSGRGTYAAPVVTNGTAYHGNGWREVQRLVYVVGDAYTWGPSDYWCRDLFGPDYTASSTATVNGVVLIAGDVGCRGDILTDPDPVDYTSFEDMCKDPPSIDLADLSTLGAWFGHFMGCLFVPRGGWDPDGVVPAAWADSAAGPVSDAVLGLTSVQIEGSCGVLSSGSIMGEPVSVDTCDLPRWPLAVDLLGVAVIVFAAFTVLTMILSALGLTVSMPWTRKDGDDE